MLTAAEQWHACAMIAFAFKRKMKRPKSIFVAFAALFAKTAPSLYAKREASAAEMRMAKTARCCANNH
jgi:hypothetical protein